MSRAGDGTYTLPLPDVVAGDDIEASWANTTMDDIATEMQDSLSRSGKGGMSAALKLASGTVSAPGLSFTSEANSGLYRESTGDIRMAVAGSEAFRVTSAGLRTVGDVILGTAGEGVDFSANTGTAATGAATTSELLSRYEEGTWTPTVQDASFSNSEGQAYSVQAGHFTRIGRMVFFSCQVTLSSVGTLSGSRVFVAGLPYTAATISGGHSTQAVTVGFVDDLALSARAGITGYIGSNVAYISLQVFDDTAGTTDLTVAEISNTASFVISGHYFV